MVAQDIYERGCVTSYTAALWLNWLTRSQLFPAIPTVWLQAHTADPGLDGSNAAVGTPAQRVRVFFDQPFQPAGEPGFEGRTSARTRMPDPGGLPVGTLTVADVTAAVSGGASLTGSGAIALDTNDGDTSYAEAGSAGSSVTLTFAATSVPQGATITGATLVLTERQTGTPANYTVSAGATPAGVGSAASPTYTADSVPISALALPTAAQIAAGTYALTVTPTTAGSLFRITQAQLVLTYTVGVVVTAPTTNPFTADTTVTHVSLWDGNTAGANCLARFRLSNSGTGAASPVLVPAGQSLDIATGALRLAVDVGDVSSTSVVGRLFDDATEQVFLEMLLRNAGVANGVTAIHTLALLGTEGTDSSAGTFSDFTGVFDDTPPVVWGAPTSGTGSGGATWQEVANSAPISFVGAASSFSVAAASSLNGSGLGTLRAHLPLGTMAGDGKTYTPQSYPVPAGGNVDIGAGGIALRIRTSAP